VLYLTDIVKNAEDSLLLYHTIMLGICACEP